MDRTTGIILSVLALAIVAVAGWVFVLGKDVAALQADVRNMEKNTQEVASDVKALRWVFGLGKDVAALQDDVRNMKQEMQEVASDVTALQKEDRLPHAAEVDEDDIPNAASDEGPAELPIIGWLAQPGGKDIPTHDESVAFDIELKGSDDCAEMFLDLRPLILDQLSQNADGSYNLAGVTIAANLRTERDFEGDPRHRNGVQFLLKDAQWRNSVGEWKNITSRVATPEGMDVSLRVPDNAITRNTAAITLKLTIGSNSDAEFRGTVYVKDIKITKAD